MRILFTTVPLAGHFFPLVPLAWACRAVGHEVLVATAEDFVSTATRSGLPVTPSGPATDLVGLALSDSDEHGLANRRYTLGRAFGRMASRSLAGTRSLVDAWRPDMIVSERAEFAGPVAAAASGIAHVELHWGVPALHEYRSAAAAEMRAELTEIGLDAPPPPVMAINPWPPSLRLLHAIGHQSMRNVIYDGAARVPDWIWQPRDRPRICLTLGTVLPRLVVEGLGDVVFSILESLARLDVELVVAVDDKVAAGWPKLPDAVRHVGRIPLSQVLGACDVVIHHGGHGTVLTAFEAGCPQVVLPQFDDQLDNAAAVVRAGAGVCLLPGQVTPQAVADSCVEQLREARFGQSAARLALEIAAQPSPVDVVSKLELVARRAIVRRRSG